MARALCIVALSVALAPSLARAQAEPAQPPTRKPGTTIEEITVTAQKREESVQDVPVSVTALPGDDLARKNFTTASDLVTLVPALQVTETNGSSAPIFALRGVSMADFSLNQQSPVAPYVDEVYKGNPALFGVQLFDLERVEVLRGPQGTLYGKNTTGGAINFFTKRPSFEHDAYVSVGFGNYNQITTTGALGGTIVPEKVAARIALNFARADGWYDNEFEDQNDLEATGEAAFRTGLLFTPADGFELLIRGFYSKIDASDYGIYGDPGPLGVGNGVYNSVIGTGANTQPDYFRQGLDKHEIEVNKAKDKEMDTSAVSITMNWDVGESLRITSISSYDYGKFQNPEDSDGSPLEVIEASYYDEATQWAQDLRLTSSFDGPFNFILGGYYGREDVDNSTDISFFTDVDFDANGTLDFNDCLASGFVSCAVANEFEQRKKSIAAYGDASFEIVTGLKLRGGLRWSKDDGDQKKFRSLLVGNDGVPLVNLIPGSASLGATTSQDFDDDDLSGKLGLDYTLPGGDLVYASWSRGYRSSAFNAQAFVDPSELTTVDPEVVYAYELGFKSQWLDDRLQVNGAAFYYIYRDQQFLDVDPVTALQTLVNIDRSQIIGAELELVARPIDILTLRLGLSGLDAEVEDGTLRDAPLDNKDLPLAAHFSGWAGAEAEVAHFGDVALRIDSSVSYVGPHYFEPINVPRLQQGSYALLDARIALLHDDQSWEVALWGRNLFDTIYWTNAIDLVSGFGVDYIHLGRPRMFGVQGTLRF